MAYPTTRTCGNGYISLAAIVAAICLCGPVSAQMVIRISVYNQTTLSTDGTTVYGVTSSADNSTLAGSGCGHSNYQTQTLLITPQGNQSQSIWNGGFTASTSTLFDDDPGEYTEVGSMSFDCSCAGPITIAGESEACLAHSHGPAQPFTPAHAGRASASKTYELSSVLKVSVRAPGRATSTEKQ
jgi:hypothetical protein